jgi:DNA polymerase elongation subunit (family B)
VVQPYQYETVYTDDDSIFDELRIYATDAESKRHVLHITDFSNAVYLWFPTKDVNGKECDWTVTKIAVVLDFLRFCLQGRDGEGSHEFLKCEIQDKKTLYYYQSTLRKCVMLTFKSKRAISHCNNLLRKPRHIKRLNATFQFELLEADIPLSRKFCTDKNIQYTDWINCSVQPSQKRICVEDSQPEWNVNQCTISASTDPMYKSIQVAMTIFCFDIEVYCDNPNDFPNAFHPLHEVFMISVTVHKYMQFENVQKYCLHSVELEDDGVTDVKRIKYKSE